MKVPPYATGETINDLLAEAMLSGRLDPKMVTDVHEQVVAVVRDLEWQIASGKVDPRVRLVCGRPLADWLSLDDVARLLGQGGVR